MKFCAITEKGLFLFVSERLAHPPLGARESVEREVEVGVIINAGQQSGF